MNTIFKNFKLLFTVVTIISLAIGIQSCYKKDYTKHTDPNYYGSGYNVNSSIYGIVKNEKGEPVKSAVINTNGYTAISDDKGFFYLNNVNSSEKNTTLFVSKDNYFNAYHTISTHESDRHTVFITLIERGNSEVFNSTNGGTVSFDGLSITFPKDAVVSAQDGSPYSGQVYVFAKRINPYTKTGRMSMPGDLRGINTKGIEQTLQNFGMMAAELYDINGRALQIAPTKNAEISFTIPTQVQTASESSLSLWYFDESKNVWIEDGSANLNGNKYVGKVNHFTYWSCNKPFNTIQYKMNFQDQNAEPLAGYIVKITNKFNNDSRYLTTSANGWIGGMMYSNTSLLLEVFAKDTCAENIPLYTKTITANEVDIDFGTITVNLAPIATCYFNATVNDCNGDPITNACVYISPLDLLLCTNSQGQINYTLPCVPSKPIKLYAYNLNNGNFSENDYILLTGVNHIGVLGSCGNSNPHIDISLTNLFTMASSNADITLPDGTLFCVIQNDTTYLSGTNPITGQAVSLTIAGDTVGTFNITSAIINNVGGFTDNFSLNGTNTATFTVFPNYPDEVQGTYQLNLVGSPSGHNYKASGTFRIPRTN